MTAIEQLLAAMTPEQRAAWDDALEAARELVKVIESDPMPTTKGHYGYYLRLITSQMKLLLFIEAGANKEGVLAAARINGVL